VLLGPQERCISTLDITELLALFPELLHSLSKATVSAEMAVGEPHTHSKCIEEEENPSLLPGIET
jgi:hypothetical protein